MADEIRVSRPGQPQRMESMNTGDSDMRYSGGGRRGGSRMGWVVLAIIVVVLVVLGVLFRDKLNFGSKNSASGGSGYQAVFLTNGQVYFGKLADSSAQYMTLTDVYYLQVINQNPIQGTPQNGQQQQSQTQPQLQLVKLGNELHGPVDEMKINRDQVLFYEDMKKDGKVVQKILENEANPQSSNQNNAPANNQQSTPVNNSNVNK